MTLLQDIKAGSIPARLTVSHVFALTAAGILREGENFELIGGGDRADGGGEGELA